MTPLYHPPLSCAPVMSPPMPTHASSLPRRLVLGFNAILLLLVCLP
ncbi:hypothetical protein B224_2949 [Aeromonas media WS]|nr:hypothetical protein B224_2949 [Aeromonas media WS]